MVLLPNLYMQEGDKYEKKICEVKEWDEMKCGGGGGGQVAQLLIIPFPYVI